MVNGTIEQIPISASGRHIESEMSNFYWQIPSITVVLSYNILINFTHLNIIVYASFNSICIMLFNIILINIFEISIECMNSNTYLWT